VSVCATLQKAVPLKKREQPVAVQSNDAVKPLVEIKMSERVYQYVYGPVPSRRLGKSLGVDIVPYKTCTYDCIYCQLGKTTNKTTVRLDYVPLADVLSEIEEKLLTKFECNYITVAGSGEPTLHASIGEIIGKIKERTNIPVAVLTNGSLLYLPEVRQSLMKADIVIPSLDAGNEQLFQYVNRPHKDISFERVIQGLIDFSKQFTGHIWLEILLLSGINGMAEEVKEMAAWTNKIHIEKVQINTVSRPAYEDYAHPVDVRQLQKLAGLFSCPVDILQNATASDLSGINGVESSDKDILDLLARRPCTLEGISTGMGLHPHDVAKKLKSLLDKRLIIAMRAEQGLFYKIAERK
jgi:wyosine [tRNA(Phe)-imidazoG37] synthetase (radical SAM superfamily)